MCDPEAVKFIVTHAQDAIAWLVQQGIVFTMTEDGHTYHLTREGGHSQRRILHVKDKTGDAVMHTLSAQAQRHANITILENFTAIDLDVKNNVCQGAEFLDQHTDERTYIHAKFVILATGGASSLFLHSTSKANATGDGIAMAWRAGCKIKNMAFHQFHPTCFYHADSPPFLITEALRGEGAIMTLADGSRFLHQHDERAELAPRDIVARAMHHEMQSHHLDHLNLDISAQPSEKVYDHFPSIQEHCAKYDIDIAHDPIPVVPAAHYTCGGIQTNLNAQTNISHLYAIGETAYTGLHGANRMASNSLLECLVMAKAAAQSILLAKKTNNQTFLKPQNITREPSPLYYLDPETCTKLKQQLQQTMWEYVGIVRSNAGLQTALTHIEEIAHAASATKSSSTLTTDAIELRNLVDCAKISVLAAIKETDNNGAHYNIDLV